MLTLSPQKASIMISEPGGVKCHFVGPYVDPSMAGPVGMAVPHLFMSVF